MSEILKFTPQQAIYILGLKNAYRAERDNPDKIWKKIASGMEAGFYSELVFPLNAEGQKTIDKKMVEVTKEIFNVLNS